MAQWKKCPRCKRDKWLSEFVASGYCKDCHRIKGRASAAKLRRTDRAKYNEYHREYQKKYNPPKTTRHALLSDV